MAFTAKNLMRPIFMLVIAMLLILSVQSAYNSSNEIQFPGSEELKCRLLCPSYQNGQNDRSMKNGCVIKDCNDQETNFINDWWFERKYGSYGWSFYEALEEEQGRLIKLGSSPNTDVDWVRRCTSIVNQMIDHLNHHISGWSM